MPHTFYISDNIHPPGVVHAIYFLYPSPADPKANIIAARLQQNFLEQETDSYFLARLHANKVSLECCVYIDKPIAVRIVNDDGDIRILNLDLASNSRFNEHIAAGHDGI